MKVNQFFIAVVLMLAPMTLIKAESERLDTIHTDDVSMVEPTPRFHNVKVRAMLRSDFRLGLGGGIEPESNFTLQPAMLQMTGNFGKRMSFWVRYRFDWPYELQSDGTPMGLLVASLSYHFNDHLRLEVGKQMLMNGSWEFDYNPMEVFFYSLAGNYLQGFQTGASLHYSVLNQNFSYQLTKVTDRDFQAVGFKNGWNNTFFWMGDLFKGRLKTTYSYTLTNGDKQRLLHSVMLGHQLNLNRFRLELDYLQVGALRSYAEGQDFSFDKSAIVFGEYLLPGDRCSLGLKCILDQRVRGEEVVTEQLTASAQVRYKVVPKYGLSVHGAYGYILPNTPERYSETFATTPQHKLAVGFIWDFTTPLGRR